MTEDNTENWRTATEILADSKDLYERKNQDYGDSWQLVGKTLAMWLEHQGVEELRIPVNEYTMNSMGLFFRRMDKMSRAFNMWFGSEDRKVSESVVETQEDQVPYAAMHTQLAEQYARMDYSDISSENTR